MPSGIVRFLLVTRLFVNNCYVEESFYGILMFSVGVATGPFLFLDG